MFCERHIKLLDLRQLLHKVTAYLFMHVPFGRFFPTTHPSVLIRVGDFRLGICDQN